MCRPYVICHMVTSIDGKAAEDFLFRVDGIQTLGNIHPWKKGQISSGLTAAVSMRFL